MKKINDPETRVLQPTEGEYLVIVAPILFH